MSRDLPSALGTPASRAFPITPSNDSDLSARVQGIYVGGAGNVALVPADAPDGAAAVVFLNVPAGMVLPVMTRAVRATGTTANGLIGLI